ncbi:hypothetical protein [Paenibacillus lemnae]|uniref:hypothetical protein n=1 Tax=Paenibacillus lemnae TaxID=1330551 RepID=UPI001B7D5CD8|nr:hypothetical protein [Paenibacillus lemnae]
MLAAVILSSIYHLTPKNITQTITGMRFRLGQSNGDFSNYTELKIDGAFKKNFNGTREFTGTIMILVGDDDVTSQTLQDVEIKFGKNGFGNIFYDPFNENINNYQLYKGFFTNGDMSSLAILIGDKTGWNSRTGHIIVVPAASREEAVKIANQLTDSYLTHDLE